MVAHYIHVFLIMPFQINLNGCPLRIILSLYSVNALRFLVISSFKSNI